MNRITALLAATIATFFPLLMGCAVETAEHAALSGNAALAREPFDAKSDEWARATAREQANSVTLGGSEGEIGGRALEAAKKGPSTKPPAKP